MKYKLIGILLWISMLGWSGCLKKEDDVYKEKAAQLQADDEIIQSFTKKSNIPAVRHQSGIYYQIIEAGEGDVKFSANTMVEIKYTARLLNGVVFDLTKGEETYKSKFSELKFDGWKIGLQLIRKGGKIRLIVPSNYGYGNKAVGNIPANAILDFDIEIVDIK